MSSTAIQARDDVPAFVVLRVHPDVLFADIDTAVETSGIVSLMPLPFLRKYKAKHAALVEAVVGESGRPIEEGEQ
jgi:hypothetical protein